MAAKRALIVDDSKTAQYRLKKLLRGYDLDTVAVDSAEAALSYLSSTVPDVVFMDHMMPGMDGFRALQIIKSHPSTATIPVIMYTSKSGDLYTSQARALGALDVVNKDTINATDLRKVLKAIHIVEDTSPKAADPVEAVKAPAQKASDLTAPPPLNDSQKALSVELRLRELEHTIDDSRRIITSRLVREMQGVRHEVRKLVGQVTEIKQQTSNPVPLKVTPEEPADKGGAARYVATAASFAVVVLIGALLYWVPGMVQKLENVAAAQDTMNTRIGRLAQEANERRMVSSHVPAPQSNNQNTMAFLPDLSWALNQQSVQEFHADLINPQLTQRLSELVSRLSSRGFEGTVRVNVSGGDFCIVTNTSGLAELPAASARLDDCMLLSELHGADATLAVTEQLQRALAESVVLNNHQIDVQVQPMSEVFGNYPAFDSSTLARQWNEAARTNNRLLINLEPLAANQ